MAAILCTICMTERAGVQCDARCAEFGLCATCAADPSTIRNLLCGSGARYENARRLVCPGCKRSGVAFARLLGSSDVRLHEAVLTRVAETLASAAAPAPTPAATGDAFETLRAECDRVATLVCPCCNVQAYDTFDGCACLECANPQCQRAFCAGCHFFPDDGDAVTLHAHVCECTAIPAAFRTSAGSYYVREACVAALNRLCAERVIRERVLWRAPTREIRDALEAHVRATRPADAVAALDALDRPPPPPPSSSSPAKRRRRTRGPLVGATLDGGVFECDELVDCVVRGRTRVTCRGAAKNCTIGGDAVVECRGSLLACTLWGRARVDATGHASQCSATGTATLACDGNALDCRLMCASRLVCKGDAQRCRASGSAHIDCAAADSCAPTGKATLIQRRPTRRVRSAALQTI